MLAGERFRLPATARQADSARLRAVLERCGAHVEADAGDAREVRRAVHTPSQSQGYSLGL